METRAVAYGEDSAVRQADRFVLRRVPRNATAGSTVGHSVAGSMLRRPCRWRGGEHRPFILCSGALYTGPCRDRCGYLS